MKCKADTCNARAIVSIGDLEVCGNHVLWAVKVKLSQGESPLVSEIKKVDS